MLRYLPFFLVLNCTQYTPLAKQVQYNIETKKELDRQVSEWYKEAGEKCRQESEAMIKGDLYKDKPVSDRFTALVKLTEDCVRPKQEAAKEIALIIDQINQEDKKSADLLVCVAKGECRRDDVLKLPNRFAPLILRLQVLVNKAVK